MRAPHGRGRGRGRSAASKGLSRPAARLAHARDRRPRGHPRRFPSAPPRSGAPAEAGKRPARRAGRPGPGGPGGSAGVPGRAYGSPGTACRPHRGPPPLSRSGPGASLVRAGAGRAVGGQRGGGPRGAGRAGVRAGQRGSCRSRIMSPPRNAPLPPPRLPNRGNFCLAWEGARGWVPASGTLGEKAAGPVFSGALRGLVPNSPPPSGSRELGLLSI